MPAASLYPRTPLIDRLQSLTKSGERIVGIDGILFPGTNVIYDFADIRQHDPVANASYVNLLTSLGTYDPLQYYAKWYDAGTHLLDFLNVRWVLTHADVDLADKQRYVEVYRGADGRIYENRDVLPRFFAVERAVVADDAAKILVKLGDWRTLAVVRNDVGPLSQARVDILRSSTTRYDLRVDSKGRALIASSIPFWPGWRVTINGKRATPIVVNSAFTGFVVPPGSSQVRVDYRPMKFWLAAVASLVTSIALLWKSRS